MGPSSAMDFIGFAKGRQETLDITVPLKETLFSFKPTEGDEHHSTREGKQRRRCSLHNIQDKPFGDADFGFSRRRGSLGQVSSIESRTPIHPLEGTGDSRLSRRRNSMGHESRSLDHKNQQQVDSNRQLLTSNLSPRVERRDLNDRSRLMEHSTENKKQRSKSGRKSCPPEKRKSLDALSNGRRSGAGSSGRVTERSQNTRNSSIKTEVSQSLRKTSLGTYKERSQSARDLKLSPTTTEPSRSDRNLKLSQSPEGSSGSSSRSGGDRKDRSRSSRRPKKNPNVDSGSSSKSYSRASKAPIRQSKSLRSLSVSGDLVDSEMVPSKTSSKLSPSPKSSRKDLREIKQSSSRSLKEMKPASSRSLQSKVQGSSAGSQRHLTKSSPIRQSRSSTKLASSPKVTTAATSPKFTTTASLRQEMKEVLKNFPDLQNSSGSPRHSPESSQTPSLDNIVARGLKAENDHQTTSFTGPLSPVQKCRSSKISQRRLSLQFECKLDNFSGSSGRQKPLRDLKYDGDNMPEVIDDTLQREDLDGKKGDKSWNICEDTPGGHAPERLTSVGVEYYADSMDEDEDILDEDDEDEAEDDTVLQDSVSLPRPNRKQILPRDPAQKGQKIPAARSARPADRFNPSFQNRDMWKSDEFNSSADLSIITFRTKEELDSASELETAMTDYTLTNHTFETYMLEQDCNHQNDKETPSTLKRTGGRRVEEGGSTSFPGLHADRKYEKGDDDDDVIGDRDRRPFSVPEDDVLDSFDPEAVGIRRKIKSKSSKEQQHPGSNSTGRSSPRKSSRSHSKKRRSGKRSGVPTSVPSSPYESSYSLRSPLSSSFTSPQTSSTMNSSSRQNPEFVDLRRQIDHARNNKTLQNYVGRGHSSPQNDDENTLGASTITTNFSTTQRTFGDNTVSTRSLFQSDVMKGSDMMKIPQRQRYDSDAELEDDEHQVQDTINSTFDLLQSNDAIGQIASILSSEQKFSPATPSKVLRRPSRECDDFFDELEEMRVSSDQSDLASNPKSSSSRDLSSREIKSSPEDELRRSSSEADRISPNSALNLSPRAAFKKKSKRSMFKRIQS
ncbi:hypothetical protein IV203_038072 [Nitzschia inconspicua]|uniref:Uncharacterized protein n=1 Tax=Nitzschia inconspicua TaxID=303405 RepID=A0A9K3LN61_9STRA|nr:hypothetical protein IV203_038072 [Nitzschia inconspicua]